MVGGTRYSPIRYIKDGMPEQDFVITGEYIELHSLLKVVGVCDSGGAGKRIVADGQVFVDGQVELRKACKIRAGQVVTLGDICIRVLAAP